MTLALTQSATCVGVNAPVSFSATGGTPPYIYSLLFGGPGGTIDASTGNYKAPAVFNSDPRFAFDTVVVTDSLANQAAAKVQVGSAITLVCDIIQTQMNLANGRVYFWDQKIMQPTDSDLYIAVSVQRCKPFGNNNATSSDGLSSIQSINMWALLDIDVISRGPAARDRKEEVLLALASNYSAIQQTTNGFMVAKLPYSDQFINLSQVDGAAIPYRFQISVAIQYFIQKITQVPYFSQFSAASLYVNP